MASPERTRGEKSAAAFRTISEVADELGLPQHVLRFWETKFSQVHPLKRGGGRRYYRPEDVDLLNRIKGWLYDDGYTIKGVQKLLKQKPGDAGGSAEGGSGESRSGDGPSQGNASPSPADAPEEGGHAPLEGQDQAVAAGEAGPAPGRPASGGQRASLKEILDDLRAARSQLA